MTTSTLQLQKEIVNALIQSAVQAVMLVERNKGETTTMKAITDAAEDLLGFASIEAKTLNARGASTSNIADLTAVSTSLDGLTLVQGDLILLTAQTTGAENGLYVVGVVDSGTAPVSRAPEMSASADLIAGTTVFITAGTAGAGREYVLKTAGATLDTTALVFDRVVTGASGTFTISSNGTVTVSDTRVKAESVILLHLDTLATTTNFASLSAPTASIVAGTSFVVTALLATGAADTDAAVTGRYVIVN